MEKNNNIQANNIENRLSQLRNSKNSMNNNSDMNLKRGTNGFPNALSPSNSSEDYEDNMDQAESLEELEQENIETSNVSSSSVLQTLQGKTENKHENINATAFTKKNGKAKKTMGWLTALIPFILLIVVVIIVVAVVMGQIMTVRDSIEELAEKFTTGIEKLVNFVQGDGWMTDEEHFFAYLNEQYEAFEELKSSGDSLDIPLVAATIHYSKQVDFEKYEEPDIDGDLDYTSNDFEYLGEMIAKDRTASFYNIAQEKVGSVSSIYPGQKRLLGHLSHVELEPGFYNYEASQEYWKDFFNYALNIVNDTGMDIKDESILGYAVNPIGAFISLYESLEGYLLEYGDFTYGMRYDVANNAYELNEFFHSLTTAYDTAKKGSTNDSGMWFSIKVSTSMNTGYEEYKDLKQLMLEMKDALKENNIEYTTEDDVLNKAKNSSDSNLRSLYDKYDEINARYLYSYTDYLERLYIPFTFFYKQDYTDSQIDIIIEEIYDQRDFFNYLIPADEYGDYNIECGEGIQAEDIEKLSNEEFIELLGPLASIDYSKTNVLASVTLAQAILESGWGNKIIPGSNNLFNIKCVDTSEQECVLFDTNEEYTPGILTDIQAYFRVYDDIEQSIEDHSELLSSYSGLTDTADYKEQIRILKEHGYATDSGYEKKLIDLIEQYDLTKFDVIVDTTSSSSTCVRVVGDYANWKQYDAQWGSVPVSTAKVCNGNYCTIQQIGCLATSLAIQVAHSGVPIQNIDGEFNPGTFVEVLRKNGAFGSGGGLGSWTSVYAVAPTFKYRGTNTITSLTKIQKAKTIDKLVKDGYYIVMEVKQGCNAGQHWVAIDHVEGSDVYMFDPGGPKTMVWDAYEPHCISRIVWFKPD